jgi:hypothetical protein
VIGSVFFFVAVTALGLKLLGDRQPAAATQTPAGGPAAPPQIGGAPPLDGQLMRLKMWVPLAHTKAIRNSTGPMGQKAVLVDAERRAQSMGFYDVAAVLQDPTNPEMFTVIARPGRRRRPTDGLARVVSAELVEEIPQSAVRVGSDGAGTILDPGLTDEELGAIRSALATEENPRHLGGLASTLEPWFPVCASLLRAKAALLETRDGRNAERLAASNMKAAKHVVDTVEKTEPGEGQKVLAFMRRGAPQEPPTLAALSRPTRGAWPEVDRVWADLARWSPPSWYGLDRMRAVLRTAKNEANAKETPKSDAELRAALEQHSREAGIPLPVVRDEVRRAACYCCEEPTNLMSGDAPELPVRRVQVKNFPPCVQEAARRLVKEVGLGVWIVDEDAVKRILSPNADEQSFVSPSALQLVLASQKPQYSGVGSATVARKRIDDLQTGKGASRADLLKAQAQMERATRAIERRRWLEWYRRSSSS